MNEENVNYRTKCPPVSSIDNIALNLPLKYIRVPFLNCIVLFLTIHWVNQEKSTGNTKEIHPGIFLKYSFLHSFLLCWFAQREITDISKLNV